MLHEQHFRTDTQYDSPVVHRFGVFLVDACADVAFPVVFAVNPVGSQERVEVAGFHGVVDERDADLENIFRVVGEMHSYVEDFLRNDVFKRDDAAARGFDARGDDERVDGGVPAVDHTL